MMIHCDGFRVSDLVFGDKYVWQEVLFYKDGEQVCMFYVHGVQGRVNPASVGTVGNGGGPVVTAYTHNAGRFRVEHHATQDGTSEVYDFIAEGEPSCLAFATAFVPKNGDMPDLVRQDQETVAVS